MKGKKEKEDHNVWIWRAKVPKIEANWVGLTTIIAFVGVVPSILVFGPQNKVIAFFIPLVEEKKHNKRLQAFIRKKG